MKLQIQKSLLLELAENNSFSEQIIKKEFPQLFEIKEETYVKVPLSEIKSTPNNDRLGELVRRISEDY